MKKILLLMAALLLLGMFGTSTVYSGDSSKAQIGHDWYSQDMYRMIPKAEHEKRFPHGHQHKDGIKDDRHCYINEKTGSYFCQFDWDE